MALKDEIRRNRKRLKLTLSDLACLLEIGIATLARWETGQFKPNVDKLMKLAEIFGVTETELLHPSEEVMNWVNMNVKDP